MQKMVTRHRCATSPGRVRRYCGPGRGREEAEFLGQHDDYSAIMLKALADRLAEACAEWLHARVRREEALGLRERRGAEQRAAHRRTIPRHPPPRPASPACPDHSIKRGLFALLQAQDIGMHLTEGWP